MTDDLACDFETTDQQLAEGRAEMSAAITRLGGQSSALGVSGVRIESMSDVFRLAESLAGAGGFIPKHLAGNPGAIAAAILTGIELGIGPMEAMRSIHIVEGKPTLSADLMLARAIRAGVRVEWEQCDEVAAIVRMERAGLKHRHSFTKADAERAGLWGKNTWAKYPASMLRARCVSAGLRAFCPDVLGAGVYVEGEIDEQPRGASTGSPEVRVLGDAVHEADEAPAGPDPFAHAHHALTQCKTDGDLRAWSRAFGEAIERAPDDDNRRGVWAAAKRKARGVVPPIQVATLTAWFLEDRQARAAKASPVTVDGEVLDPVAAALDRLPECETREMLIAWTSENAATLAAIPNGSPADVEAWACIRARCELVGGIDAEELERLL